MDDYLDTIQRAQDACANEYLAAWKDLRPRESARHFARMAGRDSLVLDVAGGPGVDVRLLRDVGLRAASGDISLESMRVARTFFPKGLLARWDFRALPFADYQFEGIWAPAALQHLPRKEILPAMAELRRVQRRGPIFITFPEGDTDAQPRRDPPADEVPTTAISLDELRGLLLKMGYVDVEVESRPDPRGGRRRWVHGWGLLEG